MCAALNKAHIVAYRPNKVVLCRSLHSALYFRRKFQSNQYINNEKTSGYLNVYIYTIYAYLSAKSIQTSSIFRVWTPFPKSSKRISQVRKKTEFKSKSALSSWSVLKMMICLQYIFFSSNKRALFIWTKRWKLKTSFRIYYASMMWLCVTQLLSYFLAYTPTKRNLYKTFPSGCLIANRLRARWQENDGRKVPKLCVVTLRRIVHVLYIACRVVLGLRIRESVVYLHYSH